ncbi:MAG: TSUP family transporter [Pseudomonadales bacterium]|nr:TSUP family transporter [Pseudomonadales bacterium]
MELLPLSADLYLFLFLIAVLAGFLDTLAGGGGLISMPALILTGIPPLAALGTNKLQGSMGTATATYLLIKNKRVSWRDVRPLMISAFLGAALGAFIVQFINTQVLAFVIPAVLLFIAVYFLMSLQPKSNEGEAKMSYRKYKNLVIPTIGGYDGMFGPGTGSFFAMVGVSCRGHELISSTAVAKPLNFATNIASLLVFLAAGQIIWLAGILMMTGQGIGAWMGAHYLFKVNPFYIRVLVVVMSTSMLLKYCHSMGWISIT